MENNTKLNKTIKILKIIHIITFVAWTIFISYCFIDVMNDVLNHDPNQSIQMYGLGFAIVVVIIGSIGYASIVLIGIIGFILSLVNKNNPYRKKAIIYFILGIIIPIIVQTTFISVGAYYINSI